jgi:hypothetical protein
VEQKQKRIPRAAAFSDLAVAPGAAPFCKVGWVTRLAGLFDHGSEEPAGKSLLEERAGLSDLSLAICL